ncbi:MAG: YlxR family protein [Bifidobacteriaceae bacterium]|jgi:predicted RNA-binding protein YlxR (DUF448 family)|nr:YlxR family protein [Bifidobacteriaceae bacterium]
MANSPIRTCVGCRERDLSSNLIRTVLEADATPAVVLVDNGNGSPGRGAWLHPRRQCVDRAISRKVWARAFRHPGGADASALQRLDRPDQTNPTGGETDGHTMSALK